MASNRSEDTESWALLKSSDSEHTHPACGVAAVRNFFGFVGITRIDALVDRDKRRASATSLVFAFPITSISYLFSSVLLNGYRGDEEERSSEIYLGSSTCERKNFFAPVRRKKNAEHIRSMVTN